MTRSSTISFAAIVVALLACKGKGEDKELPEAPALPSAESQGPREEKADPVPEAAEGSESDAAPEGSEKGDEDAGTKSTGAGASSDKDGKDDKAEPKDEPKDAGTSSSPSLDASVGDLQKRAEACINGCSAQFEKCKAVDISKLPECIQKQASCTASCK